MKHLTIRSLCMEGGEWLAEICQGVSSLYIILAHCGGGQVGKEGAGGPQQQPEQLSWHHNLLLKNIFWLVEQWSCCVGCPTPTEVSVLRTARIWRHHWVSEQQIAFQYCGGEKQQHKLLIVTVIGGMPLFLQNFYWHFLQFLFVVKTGYTIYK